MALSIAVEDIDIRRRDHINEIIVEITGSQNIDRKKEAYIAFESKEGRQKIHVEAKLKELYPETHKKFRVGNVNIPDKIISLLLSRSR